MAKRVSSLVSSNRERRSSLRPESRSSPPSFANPLGNGNQRAETRRVDIAGAGEIHQQPALAAIQRRLDQILELVPIPDDQLPIHLDDGDAAGSLLWLNPIACLPHCMVPRTATPPSRSPRQYRRGWHPATGRPWAAPVPEGWDRWPTAPAEPLDQLVADVPGVEIGEDQHIGPSRNRRARRLPLPHLRAQCRIGLELSVAQNIRRQLLKMRGRLLHPGDVGTSGAALGAVREKGHPGRVARPAGDGRGQRRARSRPTAPALAPAPRRSR